MPSFYSIYFFNFVSGFVQFGLTTPKKGWKRENIGRANNLDLKQSFAGTILAAKNKIIKKKSAYLPP